MFSKLKAIFRRQSYTRSSINFLDGLGTHGAKARPFDHDAAVRQCSNWVYAAAMLNANAVASVPLRLYMRTRNGSKLFKTKSVTLQQKKHLAGDSTTGIRPSQTVMRKAAQWGDQFEQVVDRHPVLDLLHQVNPHQNGFELTVLRMLYLQITGNCYLHPVMHDSLQRPSELWLMPSQWTRVIPSKDKLVDGYSYGNNPLEQVRFEADEVIHFRLPNLNDMHYGMGRLEAVWSALGLHDSKREMDIARFNNHARPDYLLVVKQGASAEALDRFEKQIDSKLRGPRNSGKFITITGDVTATPLNMPMDQIGDSDRVLEEIAAGFGVPISKLLANNPNRANAEVADSAWLRDTILPYCKMDEEKLNEKLLPLYGIEEEAFLAYDNPVPEDKQYQLNRRTKYVAAGIMTANEARREEGLEALPDGNKLAM
ncbi:phage portal protein [bacterium AH-315-I18]|nr:phage portal protein [Phycisphaeraceae bacterium]MBN4061080.1 phage portal protein [bacterium AH-315-I18]